MALKIHNVFDEGDLWYGYSDIEGGAEYVDADGENNFVTKDAGTYNVYWAKDTKIYITFVPEASSSEVPASSVTPEVSSEPVGPDTYFYAATGNYGLGSKTYLYTWEGEGGEGHQNAVFPGVEISDIPGFAITDATNFNGMGGIWKIPTNVLMEKFIITIVEADTTEHKTADLVPAANVFVAPEATEASANLGVQAALVKDIEEKIYTAKDKSVCNVSKEDAAALVARYDALVDKSAVDASTYWTYSVDFDHLTSEIIASDGEETRTNVTYAAIVEQLRVKANESVASAWNLGSATANTTLIVTISVVTLGLAAAGAMFIVSKKRRLQK